MSRVDGRFRLVNENIRIPKDPPVMVVIVGPCRVGTTALSNVFARLGCEAYMQPIKSMRRAIESGDEIVGWNVTDRIPLVVSKETLGPETEAEFFDPIDTILQVGYPAQRLHVVTILREPEATLTSWIRMWGEASVEKFIEAYRLTAAIRNKAGERGIGATAYVHEVIRKNEPAQVVESLVRRIGGDNIVVTPEVVNWNQGPVFGELNSNIVFFDNPPEKFIEGVREWGAYKFKLLKSDLREDQKKAIGGIGGIYSEFVRECERDLGITISKGKL